MQRRYPPFDYDTEYELWSTDDMERFKTLSDKQFNDIEKPIIENKIKYQFNRMKVNYQVEQKSTNDYLDVLSNNIKSIKILDNLENKETRKHDDSSNILTLDSENSTRNKEESEEKNEKSKKEEELESPEDSVEQNKKKI